DLAGELRGRVACGGRLEPFEVRCDPDLALRSGRPVTSATIDATVRHDGHATDVELRTLTAATPDVRVALADAVARIHVEREGVDVEGLDLRVATATGAGRILAEGTFGLDRAHALQLEVRALDLGSVRAFAPKVAI